MLKRCNPYILTETAQDDLELADWAWNSHYWIEEYSGYYHCKYCGAYFTSTQGITTDTPLCKKNPVLLKNKEE